MLQKKRPERKIRTKVFFTDKIKSQNTLLKILTCYEQLSFKILVKFVICILQSDLLRYYSKTIIYFSKTIIYFLSNQYINLFY